MRRPAPFRLAALALAAPLFTAIPIAGCGGADVGVVEPALPPFVAGALVVVPKSGGGLEYAVVTQEGASQLGIRVLLTGELRVVPTAVVALGAPVYQPGERLLLRVANDRLVEAEVEAYVGGLFRVRYLGFEPVAREDVTVERLSRPHTDPTDFPPGAEVFAKALSGDELPARVVAAVSTAAWLVRFDGFGAEHDQVVERAKIRSRQAPVAAPPPPPPPPKPSPEAEARAKLAAAFKAGDEVLVAHRSARFVASVVGKSPAGFVRVRYEGASPAEEDVDPARLVGASVPADAAKLTAGQAVFVDVRGVFLPAKVLRPGARGMVTIRFDGDAAPSQEVVPLKRVRSPSAEGAKAR